MRLKTAAALLLLGLVALVAGVGQLTWWAPDEQVTASLPADTPAAPLTVIDTKLRDLRGGEATLTIRGEGNFSLSAGRPDDVAAWVGKTAHTTIDGASSDGKVLSAAHADGDPSSPNPAGADVFATTQNASGTLEYHWDVPDNGDWQLLLATDGKAPAPQDVTITWPSNATTPWAVPLIVIGALLLAGGIVLAILDRRRGSRPGGPGVPGHTQPADATSAIPEVPRRAPGSGQGTAVRAVHDAGQGRQRTARRTVPGAAATALAVLLAAAGLGAAPAQATTAPSPSGTGSPSASASGSPTEAPKERVLLEDQLSRILNQTASAVQAGDDAKDAGKLSPRVDGSALLARTQNYKVRAAVASAPAVAPVRASKLLTSVVTTQRSWPRTVIAVTQGEGNTTPQLLTLRQATARDNYKLIEAAPLLPGATFPGTAKSGADQLPLDAKDGLSYSPADAIGGVSDRLTHADSSWKDRIADNAYINDTIGYQADIVAKGPNGNFTAKHTLVGGEATAFRTADGGALVMAPLDFVLEGTPKESGDKLTLADDAAALAGGKEATTKMTLTFRESLMIYVPKDGATAQMTVIGATRNLSAASVS
ncbi:hypothetical protein GCM10012320_10430 [Sinomonas cellulolyticus]|uniref:hypothetical protein n=1 Tax=Sinomonas cellulolyticus TaxID=2801916 RepID=UPI0019C3A121|nr:MULTISPECIES: hypothetical protein [Sinomonas]GHG44957.1 hypothetical protein GCM10012320_10430 [Sinomonas sp. KCTC 49339]